MSNDNDDYTLVYSSEKPGVNLKKNAKNKKKCEEEIIPCETTLKIQIEKKGRGGKTVTIIKNLPYAPAYFKKIHKALKVYCGVGGAIKDDSLEIQGDNFDKVKIFLIKKGFKIKV